MEDKIKASIRFELSFLDGKLDDFIKANELSSDAAVNLKSIVTARMDAVLHLATREPFGSIRKLDRNIWEDLRGSN
ncbi:MAG: hypothetical protein PHC46_04505 [Clostridia bacterium]|nr:hypothetical protein [Clostridia bacterium]